MNNLHPSDPNYHPYGGLGASLNETLLKQDDLRPHFDDPVFGPWPSQAFPIRHVYVDTIEQNEPGAPIVHMMKLACGHKASTITTLRCLAPLRIDVWHCTQCPKVSVGVRGLDLMGKRR